MHTDSRGLEWNTRDAEAADLLTATVDSYAGFRTDTGELVKRALVADPDCVMAHVLRGYLMMLMGDSKYHGSARKSLERANALIEHADARERLHVEALSCWLEGDTAGISHGLEAVLSRWPTDLMALRLAHYHAFWQGDARSLRDTVLRVTPHWDDDLPGRHYLWGMEAFGHEECGDYAAAELAGRRAVEQDPEEYWATHAVAHVMEMQGRHADGIAWMDGLKHTWGNCNNFGVHLWWHLSLYHLEQGRTEEVLRLYDHHVRAEPSDFCMDLHNAASLLWRLELYGVPVGERWEEVADISAGRVRDRALAFTDPHFTMALGAAGRKEDEALLLADLRQYAEQGPAQRARVTRLATLPACEGMAAFARGDWTACTDDLHGSREEWVKLGGSHAQRDLFELTLIAAALRGGRHALASELLAARTDAKPNSAHAWNWYAEALSASGDSTGAARARQRVTELGSA